LGQDIALENARAVSLTGTPAQRIFGALEAKGVGISMNGATANAVLNQSEALMKKRIASFEGIKANPEEGLGAVRTVPTRADVNKALKDAGGDKYKAKALLQNRGFDLNAQMKE